jgi:hypothetical protein
MTMTSNNRPTTLAAAIDALLAERGQPDGLIRSLRTAATRITRATGRSANDIPLAPRDVRPLLRAVRPAAIGITRKAWTNSLSALRQLGALTGWTSGEPDLAGELGEAWVALVGKLPVSPKRSVLRQLGAWAAARDIAPEALTESHLAGYERHLAEHDYTISPRTKAAAARMAWNLGVRTVPGWPGRKLAPPGDPRVRILPPSAFPPSFIEDLARYQAEATAPTGLDVGGRPRPQRPASAADRAHKFRWAASVRVAQGVAIESFRSLADIITAGHLRAVLLDIRERTGVQEDWPGHARLLAAAFLDAARFHVRSPADEIAGLEALQKRLGAQHQGLSERARRQLRPFNDPRLTARLFELPEELFRQAETERRQGRLTRAAEIHEAAVGLAICLIQPLRRETLAQLRLEQFERDRGGRIVRLRVLGSAVKNAIAIDAPIDEATGRAIQRHFELHRPHLRGRPVSPWLFAGVDGKRMHAGVVADRISRLVRERLGIEFSIGLLRHIVAKELMATGPNGGGLSTRGAHQAWAQLIAEKKGTTLPRRGR